MNAATPFPPPRPAISDAERADRLRAINFARGSVRYEGGVLDAEAEAIGARFVAGDLTLDKYITAVKADTVRLA